MPVLCLLLAPLNPDAQLGLVPPSRYSLKWNLAHLNDRRLADALAESALVRFATAALATPIGLSFAAIVSLIGLSAVKPSTIAAARDLGAGPLRAFVDITLPLVRANLIPSFVF